MAIKTFKIDSYSVEVYAVDRKGGRTRWGDKTILLYSGGKEIAQAVFAEEGCKPPEPYFSGGKIFYFAPASQYPVVMDLLRKEKSVYISWKPVSDPKEPQDGDAFFHTNRKIK